MTAALLLAVGGLNWIEAAVALLFLLFWIVSQIRNLVRAAGGGGPARPPVVVRPVPRRPTDDDLQRDLARQIEEFLREAPTRGTSPARRASGAPKPSRRPQAPPLPAALPPQLAARGATPRRQPASPATPALGSLGGHSSDVSRHVAGAFAHELEHLPAGLARPAAATAPASSPATPALDIAALIRQPATLRQLVIVREVLERPLDRW